jgi:hypothetical protein
MVELCYRTTANVGFIVTDQYKMVALCCRTTQNGVVVLQENKTWWSYFTARNNSTANYILDSP